MARLKKAVIAGGYTVVVDARIILIVKKGGVESSLYDDGQALLKTPDRAAAETGGGPRGQAGFAGEVGPGKDRISGGVSVEHQTIGTPGTTVPAGNEIDLLSR